jgi:TRAP transporter TAXI family solute receptor
MVLRNFRRVFRRDLLIAALPAMFFIALAVAFAYYFIKPAPPKKIVMATGEHEGGYAYFAKRYRDFLAQNGVTLEVRETAGAVQNIEALTADNSDVDVAFVQSGTAFAANAPHLVSLGSVYYEPLWVFYRGSAITDVGALQGKKIAIGPFESGTRALAVQLLSVNGTVLPPTTLLPLGGKEAAAALQAGSIDAAFFVSPAEAPMMEKLASDPKLKLLSFERAQAYTRRFPYLTELTLPKGVFDFMANIPPQDVTLVSPTANLIAKDTLHPALAYLLMRAATQIHGDSGLLHKTATFPAPLDSNFPLSPEAVRYYKTGTPFLQRYLPFWAANLVDRLWVMLVPTVAILVPLFRLVPPLYRWRVRSRIYRWYARLKEIELQLDEKPRAVPLDEMLDRLDSIERSVNRIPTPLAYSENLYSFRQHIDLVRARVQRAVAEDSAGRTSATS